MIPDLRKTLPGWDDQLSDHFQEWEFRCPHCGRGRVDGHVVLGAEVIRKAIGPFTPSSAWRCPVHNAAVGGGSHSQHLFGKAIDVPQPRKYNIFEMFEAVLEAKVFKAGGIGVYEERGFIHCDIRVSGPARWLGM